MCLQVLSSFAASISANVPESDLPFEFNYDKGSEIIGENLLTQSVSSDGKTVLSTNSPQPIKKYTNINNSSNNNNNNIIKKNSEEMSTKTAYDKETPTNKQNSYKKPQTDHVKINKNKSNNFSSFISPMDIPMAQWNLLENMSRYVKYS